VRHSEAFNWASVVEAGTSAGSVDVIWITQKHLACALLVHVGKIVKMVSLGAHVSDLNQCALGQLVLHREAPELGLRDLDVLIEVAKFHRTKVLWPDRLPQGAEIVIGYSSDAASAFWSTGNAGHGAGRRIEAGVIGYVAEVALVAHAVAAADAVAPIAENVKGKADARREGSPAGLPESVGRALIRNLDLSAPHLRFETAARAEIKVRIESGVVVVLHAVVLVAKARINGQLRRQLVAVLSIS